jgi:hypothetical protein
VNPRATLADILVNIITARRDTVTSLVHRFINSVSYSAPAKTAMLRRSVQCASINKTMTMINSRKDTDNVNVQTRLLRRLSFVAMIDST